MYPLPEKHTLKVSWSLFTVYGVVIFRKAELMLFGLLSLLMGHWIVYVAKICIKTSKVSRRFYPCALESELNDEISRIDVADLNSTFMNYSVPRQLMNTAVHHYCPKVINFDLCGIELHMDAVADIQFLHRLYWCIKQEAEIIGIRTWFKYTCLFFFIIITFLSSTDESDNQYPYI